jgi:hypothetical protein
MEGQNLYRTLGGVGEELGTAESFTVGKSVAGKPAQPFRGSLPPLV